MFNRSSELYGDAVDELSSGSKILSPSSNPAGIATVDSLTAANNSLDAANSNVQDALSYTQAATGDLGTIGSILTRMSELATAASDPTKQASDVADYQDEFGALQNQLRNMIGGDSSVIGGTSVTSPQSNFGGNAFFSAGASGGMTFDVGSGPNDQMTITNVNLQSGATLGIFKQDSSGNYLLSATSPGAVSALDSALAQVTQGEGTLGGVATRLQTAAKMILAQQSDNSGTISSINDVDVAQVATVAATENLRMQATASMLAKSNLDPQAILKLLGGH